MSLRSYGWNSSWANQFEEYSVAGLEPARVVFEGRGGLRVQMAERESLAELAGRLRHTAARAGELPAVGDWVAVVPTTDEGGHVMIRAVLPRHSKISRKVAGNRTREQVVAANVDIIVVVMGLDADFNLRRLERFMVMAWESGAKPVVVLSKADVIADSRDLGRRRREVERMSPGVEVMAVSSLHERGLEMVEKLLTPATTLALIGSSGVGKSTLINRLAGSRRFETGEVRVRDGRGRHTTTHRQLVRLPGGALLIDNPGVREIQLWSSGEGFQRAFDDVEVLASECRFGDCRHVDEPGCAIQEALASGALASDRWRNYLGLEKELRSLETRQDQYLRRRESKRLGKMYKNAQAQKRSRRFRSGW